jgi:transposase
LGSTKRLFTKISAADAKGTLIISVQKTPQRRIRKVELAVRFTNVTLASKNSRGAIRLWAIEAKEEKPPQGVKPIRWILLTSVPVTSYTQAEQIITWYTKRWLIERFHYTLKSGCRIEQLQLQERERLERAIATYEIVAWRLLWITYEARENPQENYDLIMTKEEWDVLCAVSKKKKNIPETIHEGVLMIAKLGGFLGRKGDHEPGVKTLWIGMRRFDDIMQGWHTAKQKDVGKG